MLWNKAIFRFLCLTFSLLFFQCFWVGEERVSEEADKVLGKGNMDKERALPSARPPFAENRDIEPLFAWHVYHEIFNGLLLPRPAQRYRIMTSRPGYIENYSEMITNNPLPDKYYRVYKDTEGRDVIIEYMDKKVFGAPKVSTVISYFSKTQTLKIYDGNNDIISVNRRMIDGKRIVWEEIYDVSKDFEEIFKEPKLVNQYFFSEKKIRKDKIINDKCVHREYFDYHGKSLKTIILDKKSSDIRSETDLIYYEGTSIKKEQWSFDGNHDLMFLSFYGKDGNGNGYVNKTIHLDQDSATKKYICTSYSKEGDKISEKICVPPSIKARTSK